VVLGIAKVGVSIKRKEWQAVNVEVRRGVRGVLEWRPRTFKMARLQRDEARRTNGRTGSVLVRKLRGVSKR